MCYLFHGLFSLYVHMMSSVNIAERLGTVVAFRLTEVLNWTLLLFISWETFKFLKLTRTFFFFFWSVQCDHLTYCIILLGEVNEVMFIKCLARCLAHGVTQLIWEYLLFE